MPNSEDVIDHRLVTFQHPKFFWVCTDICRLRTRTNRNKSKTRNFSFLTIFLLTIKILDLIIMRKNLCISEVKFTYEHWPSQKFMIGQGTNWKKSWRYFGDVMVIITLQKWRHKFFEVRFRHIQLEKTQFGQITKLQVINIEG